MATWEELTPEQQNIYQTFEVDLRAAQGEFQRLLNKFTRLNTTYIAQIQAILVILDDNTIVPNASGFAGSAALDSDAEMVALVSDFQLSLSNNNGTTTRNLRDKAAGTRNTGGENVSV